MHTVPLKKQQHTKTLLTRLMTLCIVALIAFFNAPFAIAADSCKTPGAADNLAKAENFLAENKQKQGVITTDSGLQYEITRPGSGDKNPSRRDTVVTHYVLYNLAGGKLQSSYDRGMPIQFEVTRVIKGWTEALVGMKVGEKRTLYVSPELAYGCKGSPPIIGPNELLIFNMELTHIVER